MKMTNNWAMGHTN